jgi:hypothetical protein
MPAIAVVVADLLAHHRPVLCLDTCDLLDIIQCVAESKARRLEHIRRLIDTLPLRPDCVKLVVSYLVPIEWRQNQTSVVEEIERKTRRVDEDISEIHLGWQHAGFPLEGALPRYSGSRLPAALTALAEGVLNWATVLDRDSNCIDRAVERVHQKTRPSHAGMLKDSIHLEHYLELCRQLQAAGFTDRRVLVSANKSDFWETKSNSNIHPDLAPQLAAVGLQFFGSLEAALGFLYI